MAILSHAVPLLAGLALTVSAAAADSITYLNERFGTRVTFPAELFETRLAPPANGDGMAWESADGSSLVVTASHNVLETTPKQMLDQAIRDAGDGRTVTYSVTRDTWLVLSGFEDGFIFYERWVFGGDDVVHGVILRYPAGRRAEFDPLVGPIARSLRAP